MSFIRYFSLFSFCGNSQQHAIFSLLKPIPTSLFFRDPLSGMTALEVACLRGHRDTVKGLLDFRPNFFPPWTAFKTTKSECQQKLVGSPACIELLRRVTLSVFSFSLSTLQTWKVSPSKKLSISG